MGKVKNIRNLAGVPIEILGEKYNLLLTMIGNDYLEEQYGSPTKALELYNQMVVKLTNNQGIDKEARDILVHFIHAAILHNAYDRQGNIIREIPTAFEIKSSLTQADMIRLLGAMSGAQKESFPDREETEEKADDPQ